MDRKLFLQHLTNSPQVQRVMEQNYNIGDYLPSGQRKPEPSPADIAEIHKAAAMRLAAKYGAHRARNELEPGNKTHLEGMKEVGARLQQTMRTLDGLSDAGHIHPKDHAEFTNNLHDAIAASGDMIRIGRKGGLREAKEGDLSKYLNRAIAREYTIPLSKLPSAGKHPTLGKFINAVYERHGNSILAKHDRLRGEDEEAGDVSVERHEAAKEKFADFVSGIHSDYRKVGKK